jgi:hypothetical protein
LLTPEELDYLGVARPTGATPASEQYEVVASEPAAGPRAAEPRTLSITRAELMPMPPEWEQVAPSPLLLAALQPPAEPTVENPAPAVPVAGIVSVGGVPAAAKPDAKALAKQRDEYLRDIAKLRPLLGKNMTPAEISQATGIEAARVKAHLAGLQETPAATLQR